VVNVAIEVAQAETLDDLTRGALALHRGVFGRGATGDISLARALLADPRRGVEFARLAAAVAALATPVAMLVSNLEQLSGALVMNSGASSGGMGLVETVLALVGFFVVAGNLGSVVVDDRDRHLAGSVRDAVDLALLKRRRRRRRDPEGSRSSAEAGDDDDMVLVVAIVGALHVNGLRARLLDGYDG